MPTRCAPRCWARSTRRSIACRTAAPAEGAAIADGLRGRCDGITAIVEQLACAFPNCGRRSSESSPSG